MQWDKPTSHCSIIFDRLSLFSKNSIHMCFFDNFVSPGIGVHVPKGPKISLCCQCGCWWTYYSTCIQVICKITFTNSLNKLEKSFKVSWELKSFLYKYVLNFEKWIWQNVLQNQWIAYCRTVQGLNSIKVLPLAL